MADAGRLRDGRAGLEFPGRALPRLRHRRRRRQPGSALRRAQRRRGSDGGDAAGMAGDRPMDAADRHGERRERRQHAAGRHAVAGQAALGARLRGREMSRFGPILDANGVTFRLWAPAAHEVEVVTDRATAMQKRGEWFEARIGGARDGTRYSFTIDGEIEIPDPGSHFQPDDVHAPSEVIDHTYDWQCRDWTGRPWDEAVILEVHPGTFTREGTYRAIIDKL